MRADVAEGRREYWMDTIRQLFIPSKRSRASVRYAFAVCAFGFVFLGRLAVEPGLRKHSPLLLFTLAVVASAVRGGTGPGLVATALGTLGAVYFFPPTHRFTIEREYLETAVFQMALFLVTGSAMTWLGGELRRRRWQAEDFAREREEILDSITDGFAAFDADGRLLYLNRAIEPLTGRWAWDESTLWKLLPTLSDKLRDVVNKRVPLELELFWDPTDKWLEFHAYPSQNGGVTLYIRDISGRRAAEERLRTSLAERDLALEKVRLLTGLLPICALCKNIRDTAGKWHQMESYISGHSEAGFSHTMCPDCAKKMYPELTSNK